MTEPTTKTSLPIKAPADQSPNVAREMIQDAARPANVAPSADVVSSLPGNKAEHDVALAINAFGATGVRRVARSEATKALLAEGFASVEDARTALTTLGAQTWCAAVLQGMQSKNPTIRRTAMQSFERAARLSGNEGALIQTFVLQFGLGSMDDVRLVLEQAKGSRERAPEQIDHDCIEWLEDRGWRVARAEQAVEQAQGGARR